MLALAVRLSCNITISHEILGSGPALQYQPDTGRLMGDAVFCGLGVTRNIAKTSSAPEGSRVPDLWLHRRSRGQSKEDCSQPRCTYLRVCGRTFPPSAGM